MYNSISMINDDVCMTSIPSRNPFAGDGKLQCTAEVPLSKALTPKFSNKALR